MNEIEETNFQVLRKFIRRTKYSMGILGLVIHALLANIFFTAPDIAANTAHNKAGLWGLIVGILVMATLIETGMWIMDKNIELHGEKKDK